MPAKSKASGRSPKAPAKATKKVAKGAKVAPAKTPKAKTAPKTPKVAAPEAPATPAAPSVEEKRNVERAQHEHQDPRGTASDMGRGRSHVDSPNYGASKARGVGRIAQTKNWFRRGAFWRGRNPPGHG
ncbi:MAG: hypothetical protein ACYDBQ_07065 [Thermoplasmatota archaeon]